MPSVLLEDISIEFPIYGTQRSFRKALFERATGGLVRREGKDHKRVVVQALEHINLSLSDGDRMGLVGHNGAGKSTLLKVLAGVFAPTSGRIQMDGKITPLFSASPGIEGEDTGYENIVTCGMHLGMTRPEIMRKIPEIEEFSELGEYLTLPVRTYSSGMTTRFGFALATALDPEILLMDEGLATGDLRFAERASERMKNFVGRSSILVLASHAESMIETWCNKAALLDSGRILDIGPVPKILKDYHLLVSSNSGVEEPSAVDQSDLPVLKGSVG